MGIFGRIWRVIKGWLLIGVEKAEDPEVILAEAQESMRRELEKAKEQGVQAIAARNQLRSMLQDQQNQVATLEMKARTALRSGDEELARLLLVEKSTYDKNIETLQSQLQQAEQAAETVKATIKQLETQVKQRAAQRLALVASWKQAKIQEQINKSLSDISLDGQNQIFQRAEDRIRNLQARTEARNELNAGSMQQRIAKLDNVVVNEQAEQALASLKAEMGLTAPAQQEEDALARLKAEIEQENRQPVPQQEVQSGRNLEI